MFEENWVVMRNKSNLGYCVIWKGGGFGKWEERGWVLDGD